MRSKILILFLMVLVLFNYACQGKKETEKKEGKKRASGGYVINFKPNDSLDLIPDKTLILQVAGAEIVGGHPKSITAGEEKDFCLDVLAKAIDSVTRVFFELNFDPSYTSYLNYKPGGLFEDKGRPIYKVGMKGEQKGKLEAEISFESGSIGISGSGKIVTLCFKALDDGRGDFQFEKGELLDLHKEKIAGINWVGGLLWILKSS